MAKLKDKLCLFNFGLMKKISVMNAGEIWDFLVANQERMKEIYSAPNLSVASVYIYGFYHSFERFKEIFDDDVEDYFEGVVFSTCTDFCFEGERIAINEKGAKGFLDRGDSCDALISDDFFPPVDEDENVGYHKEYFHLIEPLQLQSIINVLEDNIEDEENNSLEEIESIKKMKDRCESDPNYKIAYIFDI